MDEMNEESPVSTIKRSLSIDLYENNQPNTSKKFALDEVLSMSSSKSNGKSSSGLSSKDSQDISSDSDDSDIIYVSSSNDNLAKLKDLFPQISDDRLNHVLNRFKHDRNCVERACNYLLTRGDTSFTSNSSISDDESSGDENNGKSPTKRAEIKQKDIAFIRSLYPNITSNKTREICNVVYNSVTDLNSSLARKNAIVDYIVSNNLNTQDDIIIDDSSSDQPRTSREPEEIDPETKLRNDADKVIMVITDCEPNYVTEQLKLMENQANRVEILISQMLEKKNYPRLKDFLEKNRHQQKVNALLNIQLNIEEFLRQFPDPFHTFYHDNKAISDNYKEHCRVTLLNKFNLISSDSIEITLIQNNYYFIKTYRQLEDAILNKEDNLKKRISEHIAKYTNHVGLKNIPKIKFTRKGKSYKLDNVTRSPSNYPEDLNERFFKELLFVKNETQIKNYLENKKRSREQKLALAKANNSFKECQCCFDNQLLDEDMLPCSSGEHSFCGECLKSYAETTIGDCKYFFACMDSSCEGEFNLDIIKKVLDPNLFSKFLRNLQNEEIKKANIPNLESCQFCTYAAIIENPDDKVFYCQNPECLRETCRLCKEANHLPLRCNEIEKKQEVDMRTWIENRVTEAMIRTCHKCGKRFYKTEGCNMMHCVCGASMCYVCRKPIASYEHFKDQAQGGCAQFSDVAELHRIEMEKAYQEANDLYKSEHPESKNIQLKYDPKKYLDELKNQKPKTPAIPGIPPNPNQNVDFQNELLRIEERIRVMQQMVIERQAALNQPNRMALPNRANIPVINNQVHPVPIINPPNMIRAAVPRAIAPRVQRPAQKRTN